MQWTIWATARSRPASPGTVPATLACSLFVPAPRRPHPNVLAAPRASRAPSPFRPVAAVPRSPTNLPKAAATVSCGQAGRPLGLRRPRSPRPGSRPRLHRYTLSGWGCSPAREPECRSSVRGASLLRKPGQGRGVSERGKGGRARGSQRAAGASLLPRPGSASRGRWARAGAEVGGRGNGGSRGARERGGARRPRRLSRPGDSGTQLPARPGRGARTKAARGRRAASSRPGRGNRPRRGGPAGGRPRAGERGKASRLEPVPPQATRPRRHPPAPRAAPPDSGVGIPNPPARLPPSSAPWYAPGDRCLGIFNIWDAANAEVKWNTSGEGGLREGSRGAAAAWTRGSCGCGAGAGRAGAGARRRSSGGQVRGKGDRPLHPQFSASAEGGGPTGHGGIRTGGGHPESLPRTPVSTAATFLSGPCPRRGPRGRVPRSQKQPNKRSKVRAAGCGGRGGGGERVERTKGLLREARGLVPGRLPG